MPVIFPFSRFGTRIPDLVPEWAQTTWSTLTGARGDTATPLDQTAALQSEARTVLAKSDLRPGDILLFLRDGSPHPVLSLIEAGQKLSGLSPRRNNTGSADRVHAAIWVKHPGNPGRTDPFGEGEPEVAEFRAPYALNTALSRGRYLVFRPQLADEASDWAAQIAMSWAEARDLPYSMLSAVRSIGGNSDFTAKAEDSAQAFTRQAFDPARESLKQNGGFCSMFVLAAFQASLGLKNIPLPPGLRVNAQETSVRTLEHFLRSDPEHFSVLGEIVIREQDVLYHDDPSWSRPGDVPPGDAPPGDKAGSR
ncbi:hypothetical protein [Paludibacterium paludis]|uniref:Uncharacterized protein n=1 Tax=Paludibacterium paludis TaxID=1225769 RepID=A0A918U9E8_9NEIS|nr:hypothetical protein [Paludibacterium paludis]GGY13408.1 hypothetical protein GCM10011289_15890 [Paludibacterium paludis]